MDQIAKWVAGLTLILVGLVGPTLTEEREEKLVLIPYLICGILILVVACGGGIG
jgi:hypothetical protein